MTRTRWPRNLEFVAILAIASLGAAASALGEGTRDPGRAPDPPASASRTKKQFELRYQDRRLTVERVRTTTSEKAVSTPRRMGRFALELYVGSELVDRVRFNVPLLADPAEPGDQRLNARPRFDDVKTRLSVWMTDSDRATELRIVDRSSGEEQRYLWPPDARGVLLTMPVGDGSATNDTASERDGADAQDAPMAPDSGR
jgi:hypothetical protein